MMHTLSAPHLVLNTVIASAAILGAALLVAAVVRSRHHPALRTRQKLTAKQVTWIALALLVTAAGLSAIERTAWTHDAEPPITATPARFDSARPPALILDAPPGWTLRFDKARGHVIATKSEGTGATVADFVTDLTTDDATRAAEGVFPSLFSMLTGQGFSVARAPFPDTVAEAAARATVLRGRDGGELCVWVVARGKHLLTTIQCASHAAQGCRDACAPVITTVSWVRPAGVADSDLR